jgi:hypothetical protein
MLSAVIMLSCQIYALRPFAGHLFLALPQTVDEQAQLFQKKNAL